MKKAVISTGSKQYIVSEGDNLEVELLKAENKKMDFEPLLIVDDKSTEVGRPVIEARKVSAEILEADYQTEKVTSIRYKAKKRVRTVRGHRQHKTLIKITKIS
jgi:large subunit ribosomal protein L21